MAASLDSVFVVTKLRNANGSVIDSGFTTLSFGAIASGQESDIKIIDMEVAEAELIGNVKIAVISAETGSSSISETLFISTADNIEDLPEPYIPFPDISSGSESDPANLFVGQRSGIESRYVAIKAVAPRNANAVRVCIKWIFDFGLKQVADESSSSSLSSQSVDELIPSSKKMLSVSINTYSDHYNNLQGSRNSMDLWEDLLTSKYSFSVVESLRDSFATRSAILGQLEALVDTAEKGDVLVFGFSGQAIISEGNETILAYDDFILYSEIATIIDTLPDGVKFIMVSEAPFSGTDSRSEKEIILAASLSGQATTTSNFQDATSNPVGAFSFYSTKILTENPIMTYRKFLSEIKKRLPQEAFGMIQSPQIECEDSELDTLIFSASI